MAKKKREEMQAKYIKARLPAQAGGLGLSQDKAKEVAGYSPTTPTSQIERKGGPVQKGMTDALDRFGLTDDWIANEIRQGASECTGDNGRVGDYKAHIEYIRQVSFLRGHAKRDPLIAVQTNNYGVSGSDSGPDGAAARLLEGKIEGFLEALEAEVVGRGLDGVHANGPQVIDAQAYPDVERSDPGAKAG